MEKIFKVDSVELKLLKSNPPKLIITAHGTVSTAGWQNPHLVMPEIAPVDGIYQLDFFAEPPSGMVIQVLMPISATYVMENIPDDLKGIKVIAKSNDIVQTMGVEEASEAEFIEFTPRLENIMGMEMVDGKLKIRVSTGGCTTKESFRVHVNKGFTGFPPYIVEVYRVIPDYCKGHFPDGIVLEYDLKELNIEPHATFRLENKIGKAVR